VRHKKPKPRTRKPGVETDIMNARNDARGNNTERAAWALDELERMAKGQTAHGMLTAPMVIVCLKEILAHEGVPRSLEYRASAGIPEDKQITIHVEQWAAKEALPAPAPVTALPPPTPTIKEAVVIEPGMPRTNNSPVTPALNDRERLRAQVIATRETIVIDMPPGPTAQPRIIGRMSQGKPYELGEDERRRIMQIWQRKENQ
jgi:hypothetical protein